MSLPGQFVMCWIAGFGSVHAISCCGCVFVFYLPAPISRKVMNRHASVKGSYNKWATAGVGLILGSIPLSP